MMNLKNALFGEKSVTKVAGLYDTRAAARAHAAELVGHSQLDGWQVSVLSPAADPAAIEAADRRLLPEEEGIVRTLIRAHVTLGLAGLVAGALVAAALLASGNAAAAGSPIFTLGASLFLGALFGLILGGAVSLRPDQSRVVELVNAALRRGQWAVVAHPVDDRQTQAAVAALHAHSVRVVRSL